MVIEINSNKLCNERQIIDLRHNNVLTLVGENGCGKSSILQSVFKKHIESEGDTTVVCFTSGQNELFSQLFNTYKRDSRKYRLNKELYNQDEGNNIISAYFFHYDWVRILVFFANLLKPNGKVRDFLTSKNYIRFDNNRDVSTILKFPFRIRKYYTDRIRRNYIEEAKPDFDFSTKLLKNSFFHRLLDNILREFAINFDFTDEKTTTLSKRTLYLNRERAYNIFGFNNEYSVEDIQEIFSFLSLATEGYESNIILSECSLMFNNNLEFRQLSDGEYQLLSMYALIDLFDSNNTIFLLDEIDSHLYYKNLEKLWNIIKTQINGKVITTTHIAESIIQNPTHECLKLVEKGKINNNYSLNFSIKRLQDLSSSKDFEFKLASSAKNILLIDNLNDWIAFKTLAAIKCIDFEENIFESINVISVSSGPNNIRTQIFGDSKIKWVEKFKTINDNARLIKTKRIFMLCDKDSFPIGFCRDGVKVSGDNNEIQFGNGGKAILLSWQRRQIENYYMSYTLATSLNILNDLNQRVLPPDNLEENSPMDKESVKNAEVKDIFARLYCDENGLNISGRDSILRIIPSTEISEDITNMYTFLKNNIAL